jgi:hypothetical protein
VSPQAPMEESPPFPTPTIEVGVSGPRGEEGFLLRAPFSESLAWDVENEVLRPRRVWIEEYSGWWIAAGYLEGIVDAVLRSFSSVLVLGPEEDILLSRDQVVARQERLL